MTAPIRRAVALFMLVVLAPQAATQGISSFKIRFAEEAFGEPYTGELFVAFADLDARREPRAAMHGWFGAPPVLRFEVEGKTGGESVTLTHADAVLSFPTQWDKVEAKTWRVQAVVRASRTGRQAGRGEGDVFSAVAEIAYAPAADGVVELVLDTVVERESFAGDERTKLFELVSPSLSKFHGFDYTLRAGVLLPPDYGTQDAYPVVYSVTGFGGSYASINSWRRRVPPGSALESCILVVPDATNRYGHSVFCDSDSIGPWGEALVRELIPALEKEFGGAGPEHRYVTGVSSGGWSSLWLQMAYPDAFSGCWSHAPDPIDFHDFQQIDLYDPLPDGSPRNMYVDENGDPRPLARRDGTVTLTYEEFVRREHVLNPGGQIRSFEATFSPPASDGTPGRIFDVETGAIDHEAAAAWRKFDISHQLLSRWDELREPLAGKLHVYAGEVDTFYLEGAVERFRALAVAAGMLDDMVVEVIPGMPHTLHRPGFEHMIETIEKRWAEARAPISADH